MSDEKALTAVRKRHQIEQAQRAMLVWVGVASAVVAICVVLGINFIQRISYNAKVIGAKDETNKILKSNISNITPLKENVNKLHANSTLIALKADPADGGEQVVIDALPTVDDRTALAASLQQKILAGSGVTIDQISTTDNGSGTTSDVPVENAAVQEISFSFTISGSFDSIKNAITDVERSLRPITITSMTIQGGSEQLQAVVNATTYYLPSVHWKIGSKEIQP